MCSHGLQAWEDDYLHRVQKGYGEGPFLGYLSGSRRFMYNCINYINSAGRAQEPAPCRAAMGHPGRMPGVIYLQAIGAVI